MEKQNILCKKNPVDLFGRSNPVAIYKKLRSKWHPDKGGDKDVFDHINKIYSLKSKKTKLSIPGISSTFSVLKKMPNELGFSYICDNEVIYSIDESNSDLLANAEIAFMLLKSKLKTHKFKSEFYSYLPIDTKVIKTDGKESYVVIPNKNQFIRLSDILLLNGVFDARHVAWIISRLLNLACYLEHIEFSHNAFSIENIFIHPQNHSISLLGGWLYSTLIGERLKAIPNKTMRFAPSDLKNKKLGNSLTDLELIKAVGKELLGDISGSTLRAPEIPDALITWLKLPCTGNAVKEFQYWDDIVLPNSFGPRKFITLDVQFNDIY